MAERVTDKQYFEEKHQFCEKHNLKADLKVYTSSMENNRYHKEYCWSDGHVWYEVTDLVTERCMVYLEDYKVTAPVEIELWRTEYWSTEHAASKYLYERA